MKNVGYYNGEIAPLEELKVNALDRAVYFGDGVYDVAFIHNRKPVDLDDHLDRFYNSCKLLKIEIDMTREEMENVFLSLIEKADEDEKDFILYWQMSRGIGARNHIFPDCKKPSLFAYITPKKIGDQSKKVKLLTQEDNRFYLCNIKTINLIPNCLASEAAKQAGCDEAVFHRGNIVTEGSHTANFIIKDGTVITHPLDNLILPSITRKHVLEICREFGIPCEEREYTLDEMFNADEVLIGSTTTVLLAADEIDGKKVGGKNPDLVKRIQDLYFEKHDMK
ncbi:MAG: aminotransferase class IV [Clostridia bacterium]|nr:D-amino acid aminotransferase [Oscillospiraceae bacterium]MBQ6701539.1 aminotransferase class IV [Clostridia bacterium]